MRMLTTREAAAMLGVSTRRVTALIEAGDLQAQKFGRSWAVDEASVREFGSRNRSAGRPKMGERNPANLERYTLMNCEHAVLDFTYNRRTLEVGDLAMREGLAWKPLGIGLIEKTPNRYDLAAWIRARSIPDLRPHLPQALRDARIGSAPELMFSSLGLNLSDQYWFRPIDSEVRWADVNYFQNGYEEAFGSALLVGERVQQGMKPTYSPDVATGGALAKAWTRRDGVDCLLKSGTGGENREPYNELLATRMLARLLDEGEYVPYSLVERRGRVLSSCPSMVSCETELVPSADVLCAFGVSEGRDAYQGYLQACAALGVEAAERSLAKMIVADYLMMNFDRHVYNFGLVRNAESLDGYRVAPLFDNGCGFCCRATLGELAHGRYLWESHPFSPYPIQQLALVNDFGWYDPSVLEGFDEEIAEVFGMNPQIGEEFVAAVQGQFAKQLRTVNDVAAEHGVGF